MDIIRMRAKSVEDKKYRLLQDRLEAGLSEGERYFLTAAEIGDIDTLKSLLNEGKVSINCVDPQGRTALELAVAANVEGVVCHLLDKVSGRIVHKAFLCACDYDRDTIFEIILQHPIYARSPSDEDVELTMPLYSKYVTRRNPQVELQDKLREALIRAAKRNNFQIVKQLMLRGATLVLPHDYFCNCNQCTTQRSEDFKVYTSTRLDTFRAMASPAYMVLTEEDPIISAFRHSVNFRKMAEIESEFKLLYNQLDQQVQDFTTDLMDQCHSSDEVKTILSGPIPVQEEGDEVEEDDNDSAILPILTAAIKMGQKKFVAHNQSQAQIAELWYSGVPFLRYLNRFTYLMLAIPIGILLVPVMSVIYLVWPWGKITKILSTPLMRFLSYTCSYLSFIILVMVTKLRVSYFIGTVACDQYNPFAFAIFFVLLMWIVGLIWEECKQIGVSGAKDYFGSLWNVIDFLMLSFLLASFILEIITPIRIRQMLNEACQTDVTNASFMAAKTLCNSLRDDNAPLDRFCHRAGPIIQVIWEPAWVPDPELISDVLFTFGTILTIGRFSFIMPANEALGTMLVSFKRCLNDLLKLCGMFILVIISFASGLSALYSSNKCRNKHFKSFAATVSSLTWSLFGMGEVNYPVLRGKGRLDSLTNSPNRESGVETIGYYLYAIYVFAAMIILLNLLIAVMSNSFQEVQDESDVEWKFARTELWLTFIEPGTLVPPPFNIIPSPKSLVDCCRWCRNKCSCTKKKEEPKTFKYACVQTSDFDLSQDDSNETRSQLSINSRGLRQDLYCTLIRRYVREVEKHKVEDKDDAGDDILRRLIEKTSSRADDKMEDLFKRIRCVETGIDAVKVEEDEIKKMQIEQMEIVKQINEKRDGGSDRFLQHLDQAKLELLARMESERKEVLRIWEEQLRQVIKKMDESRRQQDVHLTSVEAKSPSGSKQVTSSTSPRGWKNQ